MDGWSMAIIIRHIFGGRPKPVTVLRDVTGGWNPPAEEYMSQMTGGLYGLGVSLRRTIP